MKKDAYYFPHFSNARNDVKILKLRRVLGTEGYAIYFMLLEILRDQTDWKFPLSSIPELEFELRVSKEKISTVIMDFELFEIDQSNTFFSPKLIQYLQPYIEKSKKARESALIRWNNANALLPESESNARRGEESKVNESKVYPSFEDFWKKYDKKVGKIKAEKNWENVSQADREKIMLHLPLYTQKERQFRKDPERYLKHRTWEDEVVLEQPKNKGLAFLPPPTVTVDRRPERLGTKASEQ